ncbi:hypothetical protein [Phyllobacterium zundukense]|uniref:Uncharacterized protein n=1 Tax=Phyllobacterium zundukense TaxID=1867719 RepID=A0ACD4D1K2_9HYPH|nr:hypothetical protein [Phyllobacterium zundukense]UXN59726.1 hypothetical protein N8E88_24630 [Phyllobacterium zundukense]
MSTCENLYQSDTRSFAERLAAYIAEYTTHVVARIRTTHEVFIRERRLRATEMALDGLPENMRCDIGWPDLYERQVSECNELKNSRS